MEQTEFQNGEGAKKVTKEILSGMHVADIAENLEAMDEQVAVKVFRMMPKDKAAEVFAYLSGDMRQKIIEVVTDREIRGIIDELFLDDAVDFIEEMPANVVKRILASVPRDKRDIINQFLKYNENSAGSIMTIEYVSLKKETTVHEAFEQIRAKAIDKETIYTCYVTDMDYRLIGTISALTLLLANPDDIVGNIMESNIVSASTSDSKESLVNSFMKYDLLAMPVVDSENRLVGIVTVDDALDAQEEAATEDFEKMAAMSPSDDPYLKTSVWVLTKNRVMWLLLLMLSATVTGSIISGFEDALAIMPALVAFIPMLMNTGGNAGCQSSTIVIRGMAVEEISTTDIFKVLWKELRVAVLCGAALVTVNFIRIMLTNGNPLVAATVSLSLYTTVIMAKSAGCLLPMAAKKLKMDPAVMSSPVITTLVDAGTLLVYFSLAKAILKIV